MLRGMGRESYLDDCVLPSERQGHQPMALDDEEETHESELSGAANYASLLGLGAGMRKKRPCIELDPEEAENGVRLVQHAAAHQMSGDDEGGLADFVDLPDLTEWQQPVQETHPVEEVANADEQQIDVETYRRASELDEVEAWDFAEDEANVASENEAEVDDVAFDVAAAELQPLPELPFEWPMPIEETAGPDADPITAIEEPELPLLDVPTSLPPGPPRHSLRQRIPAPQSAATPADHLSVFLRRLWLWLKSL